MVRGVRGFDAGPARLRQVHTTPSRRALGLWKREHEDCTEYWARTTWWVEEIEGHIGIPRWDAALAACWWRYVGQVVRQVNGSQTACSPPSCRGAMLGGAKPCEAYIGERRIRRDDALDEAPSGSTDDVGMRFLVATDRPADDWNSVARDRTTWMHVEEPFICAVLRRRTTPPMPRERFMARESPPPPPPPDSPT